MAIIKTHFFNISFEHKDLMKMLIKMNEFKEINLHNANKLIDDINDKIDNIVKIKEDITKEKEENDEAIILLKNLEESKISVDDVKNTKYITCRFGKIPVNEFTKIQYYRDYEFIFRELNRSKQYVWIVYAGLTSSISEIDNAFSSMSFEPISLPEFAHGKVHEAIDELTEESTAMEQYIAKMDSKLEDIKKEYKEEVLETFTRLYNLKRLFDKCRYVVDFSQKASVYTFSSLGLKEVETKFDDIDSIKIIELPVDIYEKRNIIAPVIVKNNTLFQPFENVLSVTLGDVFDPTALVAILTMIISAVCVGDIGVGILLLVLGLLVNIKKTNNFGGMLKRIGAVILVGGLFYGTLFYQIELYKPLFNLPMHVIHTFLFGFGIWIITMIILIIAKKVTRKSIRI